MAGPRWSFKPESTVINSRYNCRLDEVSNSIYVVKVSDKAQFRSGEKYDLELSAASSPISKETTKKVLRVFIGEKTGEIASKPKFTSQRYKANVSEDSFPGSFVLAVDVENAADVNEGRVIFSIAEGDDFGWFAVHPYSGLIVTRSEIDRELSAKVNLRIRAQDSSARSSSSFAAVEILIDDVNDNEPEFRQPFPERLEIREDVSPGKLVARVQAEDRDEGENGAVSYSLKSRTETFSIKSDSGEIFLKSRLDREREEVLKVTVRHSVTRVTK